MRSWRGIASASLLSVLLVLSMVSYAAAATVKGSESKSVSVTRQIAPKWENTGYTDGFSDGCAASINEQPMLMYANPKETDVTYLLAYWAGLKAGFNSCQPQPTITNFYTIGQQAGYKDGMAQCSQGLLKPVVWQSSQMVGFNLGYKVGLVQGFRAAGCSL
jgi:hypothetical protein